MIMHYDPRNRGTAAIDFEDIDIGKLRELNKGTMGGFWRPSILTMKWALKGRDELRRDHAIKYDIRMTLFA